MRYTVDDLYGCWLWTGRKDRDGYARWSDGRRGLVHRDMWVDAYGPIGAGLELEHECRRRACVRPSHKTTVTRGENLKRIAWRRRAAIKQCSAGHDLSRTMLRTPEGGHVCRECNRREW